MRLGQSPISSAIGIHLRRKERVHFLNALPYPTHDWYGHAVPYSFVSRPVWALLRWLASIRHLCVVARHALQPLTFERGQATHDIAAFLWLE